VEIQIETSMKYCYISITMANIWSTDNASAGKSQATETLTNCWWELLSRKEKAGYRGYLRPIMMPTYHSTFD
jgi:hypothetical protein